MHSFLIGIVVLSSIFLPLSGVEFLLKERIGDGVGYRKQYTTIELFHAFEEKKVQPFIDVRYLIFEKARQGGNLGAGVGYLFPNQSRLALYGYFDLRDSCTKHLFTQLTSGISYTLPLIFSSKNYGGFEFYLNSYFPLKSLEKNISPAAFAKFQGNNLFIRQTNRFALTGGNFEVGYRSCDVKGFRFYLAGSPYFFKRASQNTRLGGLGKLRVSYKNFISVELRVLHDHIHKTDVNVTIGLRIPLGKKSMRCIQRPPSCCLSFLPPERFEPIVLSKDRQDVLAKECNGTPLNFIFVDNLSSSDGTFESPFPTLTQAQNTSKSGDFIYVFPGDGTTMGMDQGLTMKPAQTLAGSGRECPTNCVNTK